MEKRHAVRILTMHWYLALAVPHGAQQLHSLLFARACSKELLEHSRYRWLDRLEAAQRVAALEWVGESSRSLLSYQTVKSPRVLDLRTLVTSQNHRTTHAAG